MVILITGRAGAGKSTYANKLAVELAREGKNLAVMDSELERQLDNNMDFSDEGRFKNLMKISDKAKDYENAGMIVIIAAIAPKREWRKIMRKKWKISRLVYIPGGKLWPGTEYERPDESEYEIKENI